jgi:hypothetical protein
MKKFFLLFALSVVWGITNAQDTIRVAPDYTNGGSLEKAIDLNGPNKVYLLEVNGYYTLNKTIEFLRPVDKPNAWYHIVGEKPKKTGDYMPVLQTGLSATNVPFSQMFTVKADVKFKDLFLANQAVNGQLGRNLFQINAKVRFELDGCVVDPCGTTSLILANTAVSDGTSVFVTNNQLLRQGDKYSPNGGHLINISAADTIYIENNSIVSTNHTLINVLGDDVRTTKFIWFNHNTVVFHGVSLSSSFKNPEMYVTNNLFYDLSTFAQVHAWAQYDPDNAKTGSYSSLAKSDTLYVNGQYETLPSTRTNFYNSNLLFSSKAHNDSILGTAAANPTGGQLWQFPMVWNEDVPHYYITDWATRGQTILNASREAKMYKSPDFPRFREANTIYDVNPNFVDTRIDAFSKDVASSALYWYRTNKLLAGTNPTIQKSSFWDVDGWAGTTAAYYPTVWPRWNGKYTNPTLLTASNAGLPLGDLNAFPDKRAIWQANKVRIANHIKTLSTNKLDLTGLKSNKMETSVRMFPNPVTDYLRIEAANVINNVKIYSTNGSLVKEINVSGDKLNINVSDLSKGAYLVEVKFVSGARFSTNLVK